MQLMTSVIPTLQNLSREGEYGRQRINQYTRYLTVPMAVLQAYGFLALLNSRALTRRLRALRASRTLTQIVTLTAGAIARMWLGELITEKGHRQRRQLRHLRGHRHPVPGAIGAISTRPNLADRVLSRDHRDRRGRGHHLHPGGTAADPHPVREPRPWPPDVSGRFDVPAAAGQPGGRDPDHLRHQHPALPKSDRAVLHHLAGRRSWRHLDGHRDLLPPPRLRRCCTSC